MSTTAMLRWVHQQTNGDIHRSMSILYFAKNQNAKNAYRTLRGKARTHPGCTHFSLAPNGLIELQTSTSH